jgi:hypothetical protein
MTAPSLAARSRAARAPVAVAAGVGAAVVALTVWNPGDGGTAICPSRMLGLDCPLCGGMRAVGSLGRLDLAAAADHNLLVVALVPVAIVGWFLWWRAARRGRPAPRLRLPTAAWVLLVALVVVFTVVRNLDAGPLSQWLASDLR